MEERYYVVKLLTNTQGQDASSISVFLDDENKKAIDKARVHYHHTLEIYHNADDVLYAVVSILNIQGNCVIKEIVDHIPVNESEAPNEVDQAIETLQKLMSGTTLSAETEEAINAAIQALHTQSVEPVEE